jgi:uncharacterized protein YbdZ (MbtH family)
MTESIANKAQLLESLRTCLEYIDERKCYMAGAHLSQCIDWVERTLQDQPPHTLPRSALGTVP